MLSRYFYPGKWKNGRGKVFKLYSTRHRNPEIYHADVVSTNFSITENVKSGRLETARKLFDEMPVRTVVSWNAMISGYSKWGRFDEALGLVWSMHHGDMKLNEITFSTVFSACANLELLEHGKQIHGIVLKSGYEGFEFLGSALLYFYANCFEIEEAKQVFDELRGNNELLWTLMLVGFVKCRLMSDALNVFEKMPKRDVVAWTTMISGYAKNEEGCEKALELFRWMMRSGEGMPNEFTLDSALRTCGKLGLLHEGRVVHGVLVKHGCEFDRSICGALIALYCECEAINDAKSVYHRIENPCLNTSNALLDGLIKKGMIEDAELILNQLSEVNVVSYNLMIKGYAFAGRVEDSKRLFEKIPRRTIVSSNIMISVYSRNGEIDKALKLFEETKEERNPVTWNSMMSGYIHNDQHEDALRHYMTMHRLSIERTRSTFSVIFHACSCIGSLQQGQLFHAHLTKTPFESNLYVGTSLIDMYAKCGSIADAETSFTSISFPNVAAWTALINGYAHHGLGSKTIYLFENMLEQGVLPNGATFVGILSACGRAGLVTEGMRLFQSMESCYAVIPTVEHYACVVDILGRSGHLKEAEDFINQMPIEADGVIWGALLSACWFWMDMKVGERVAEKMFSLHPKPISAYVTLSNIYALLGKWEEKIEVRKRLRGLEMKKDPGRSWIELNSKVHVFSVDDRMHPHCNLILSTLEHLTVNLNSVVQLEYISISMKDDEYFNAACYD